MTISIDRLDGNDWMFHETFGYGKKVAKNLISNAGISWLNVGPITENQIRRYTAALECIIANAVSAQQSDDTTCWVAISFDKNYYKDPFSLLGYLGYANLKECFDKLKKEGFIHVDSSKPPYLDHTGTRVNGRRTAYRLSDKMLTLLDQSTPEYYKIPVEYSDSGTCVVKNKDKIIIGRDYEVEKQLKIINHRLREHSFISNNYFIPQYKAVHHKGFGGRIYADCQRMSSHDRARWIIDDEHVVNLDLSACHTSILYSLENKELSQDHYEIDGIPRSLVKCAINIMINSADRSEAMSAVRSDVRPKSGYNGVWFSSAEKWMDQSDLKKAYNAYIAEHCSYTRQSTRQSTRHRLGIPLYIQSFSSITQYYQGLRPHIKTIEKISFLAPITNQNLEPLFSAIEQKHADISKYFYTGFGMRCQGIEGELAVHTLNACLGDGIAVLNVHDGFYCARRHVSAVKRVMELWLSDNKLKINIKIK
jgi:hypothetical protein